MDREYFKDKILCGIHRAFVRGIKLGMSGWLLNVRNNIIELSYPDRAYILGMILEGRYSKNPYPYYSSVAARTLAVSEIVMQSFNNGYCTSREYRGSANEDEKFAFDFGRECRKMI